MASILIIDDDPMFCDLLSAMVQKMEHEVTLAHALKDGWQKISNGIFDVVFLDVHMPDGNGLDLLPLIQKSPSAPEIIIMTGTGDPDGAEIAIKNGAWDYIQKPASMHMMILPMVQALQYRAAKQSARPLADLKMEGVIGSSSQIRTCFEMVGQAARSEANVLIRGETGTGKELIAWAIHRNSSRAERSFVVVDCAALADTLVESILFGYEKSAFTGAEKARDGLIKQADGGTLFLDEVGELPPSIQKAFLRVLQEHRFRPVGGQKEVESEFRLVAATNRDLGEMAKSGHFRSDLFFRLQGIVIELPPLRDRGEDIKELALYHMKRLCHKYGLEKKEFSSDYFQALSLYDWPGNVRELVNTLENIIASARYDPVIYPKHLPTEIRVKIARTMSGMGLASEEETKNQPSNSEYPQLRDYRGLMEREYLTGLLKKTGNSIPEACRISGLSRSRLYALLKFHRLTVS